MNRALAIVSLFCTTLGALEYEVQFDDRQISVSQVVIAPREEIGLHRDLHAQIVYPLKGGRLTRIEDDGSLVDVDFPTGKVVLRKADPEDHLHKTVSRSDEPIELIIVQQKTASYLTDIAKKYVATINKLSHGEEQDYYAIAGQLLSPDCKKIFNGACVASSSDQFVADLLEVYKNHGSWTITPVDIIPSLETNTVVMRLMVDIQTLGKYTELLILRLDNNNLISEINIVFSPLQESGYSFEK